ncbi:hypothetical protein NKH48_35335, partial [Mesorhizobium sp. M1233]|uniref:hypothetical protein n=1 Tax=Mesorhizobium sp. M1233 TaxID=2957072 RepID=UPI0033383D4A
FQLASAQSNVSIGHGTSPSTGIGDRNVTRAMAARPSEQAPFSLQNFLQNLQHTLSKSGFGHIVDNRPLKIHWCCWEV